MDSGSRNVGMVGSGIPEMIICGVGIDVKVVFWGRPPPCRSHRGMRTGSASGDAEYTTANWGCVVRIPRCERVLRETGSASGDAEYTTANWGCVVRIGGCERALRETGSASGDAEYTTANWGCVVHIPRCERALRETGSASGDAEYTARSRAVCVMPAPNNQTLTLLPGAAARVRQRLCGPGGGDRRRDRRRFET